MTVTIEQTARLIRAATLINAYGHVLSDHEAELTRACVERFRDRGDRTVLTVNEWRVIDEAVGGMAAAHQDAERNLTRALAGGSFRLPARAQDRGVKGEA